MTFKAVGQNSFFPNGRDLSFNQVSIKATEIGEYNQNIPLAVAKSAIKNDGLDQIIFEANHKRYVAYADGLNFEGLKKGNVPSSIFKGNLPMTVRGNFEGHETEIRILHIDDESNTYSEGAKNLLLLSATQAVPTAIQVGLAPAAGRAAEKGTNLMAKITRWSGKMVTKLGEKTHLGTVGVSLTVGGLMMAAGVAGGALYYGYLRGKDYEPVKGLMVNPDANSGAKPSHQPVNPAEAQAAH